MKHAIERRHSAIGARGGQVLPTAFFFGQRTDADLIRDCIAAKAPAHDIDTIEFVRPERAMQQIGI